MSAEPQPIRTLGEHRAICAAIFGEDSPATAFLDEKIKQSSNGGAALVLVDEGQLVYLLGQLHLKGSASK